MESTQPIYILGVDTSVQRTWTPRIPPGWDPQANFNRGQVNTESYNYYTQDVVLSGLHKSINRGFNLEAIKWGLEQFYTNKYVRNWTWNVLLELSLKSVGPADPTVFLRINYLRNNFYPRGDAYMTAVLILCQARKTNTLLFADLLYPELKTKGVADRVPADMTPTSIQKTMEIAIFDKDLGRALYGIYLLAFSERRLSKNVFGSDSPIALVHESFNRFYPNEGSYAGMMLDAAMQEDWRFQPRSVLIYIQLLHLHCSNTMPEVNVIQQFPADNLEYLDILFRQRNPIISWFGPTPYQMDLATGEGRKEKRTKDEWIRNMQVLDNEDNNWSYLSDFYAEQVRNKKSKKLR